MPRKRPNDENNVLRMFRSLRNMSQKEAATTVGVSRALWSAWEGRTRRMSIDQLNTLQKTLRLSDDQILAFRRWWSERSIDPYEELLTDVREPCEGMPDDVAGKVLKGSRPVNYPKAPSKQRVRPSS